MTTIDATAIARFNTGIARSRVAYQADRAVEDGLCAICHKTPKSTRERRCNYCRYRGLREQT